MRLTNALRAVLAVFCLLCATPSLAQPPPLSAYGDLPSIEDMAISSSGKNIAFVARIRGERQLVIVDNTQKPRINAPLGDMKLRYLQWAGEDMLIVVIHATEDLPPGFTANKVEVQGALVVSPNTRNVEMIFKKTPSIGRSIWGNYGIRQINGKWLGYFGGIKFALTADRSSYVFDHGRPHLYAVDLEKNRPDEVARPAAEGHWRSWLVDANGNVAVTLDLSSSDGKWQITNSANAPLAAGIDPTGDIDLVAFGSSGSSLVYSLEDDTDGVVRWYEVPLAGGPPTEILSGVNIERTYIDPASGRLLGYRDGDSKKPVLFDTTQQSILGRVYKAFPKLDVTIEQWTPDFKRILVRTSGNQDSGTWYLVDLDHKRADAMGYDRPAIQPENVGPISTVSYKAGDGLDLDGILTLPPGREARDLPVILFPHGGPNAHDTAQFDWWAQAFASRGYAVFQPNFRGSTNRTNAFMHAGDGQWGRKMQSDISDGLAELARRGIVNPRRACIMGASYGGYAALAGVTLQHGLYRCAIAVAPVSDLKDMYYTEVRESGENKMLRRNYRQSLGDPKTFDEVSPRRHAARADAPILLIHGKDDTVVQFSQSERMASALRAAGKPHELVVLREEDHWLSRSTTRQQMLEATVRFVSQHNPAD